MAAIAKADLKPGQLITQALGSFEVRGEALLINEHPNHLPIGLMRNAVVKRAVEKGQMLSMADVDLPDTLALKAWQYTLKQAL